jgi:hypothetical protein
MFDGGAVPLYHLPAIAQANLFVKQMTPQPMHLILNLFIRKPPNAFTPQGIEPESGLRDLRTVCTTRDKDSRTIGTTRERDPRTIDTTRDNAVSFCIDLKHLAHNTVTIVCVVRCFSSILLF